MAAKKAPMKRPPSKNIDLNKLDQFAAGANKASTSAPKPEPETQKAEQPPEKSAPAPAPKPKAKAKSSPKVIHEWEKPDVNEKVIIPFNIRTNQVMNLKLKHIAKYSPNYKSVHEFCMTAIKEKMEKELAKLLK
jgi:hypothetical protein